MPERQVQERQVGHTGEKVQEGRGMTVAELIELLKQFNPNHCVGLDITLPTGYVTGTIRELDPPRDHDNPVGTVYICADAA